MGVVKKRVLFVFPTLWDERQLESCAHRWQDRFEVLFTEPRDADCPASLDVLAFIEDVVREHGGRIDGVTSSSDYPGAQVAAVLAARLGLPGPAPEAVLRASHKLLSRHAQLEAAPEAVPP